MLYYFGRAHTNGDTFVVFPALRAMHSGDAFATKGFPNVDVNNGGSLVEYGKTLAKAASTIKNVDTIINGHIPAGPTPFADLQVYADFNKDLLAYVQDAIKAKKTLIRRWRITNSLRSMSRSVTRAPAQGAGSWRSRRSRPAT